ncbi:hypothetical protein [Bradyrhizobium sp.]
MLLALFADFWTLPWPNGNPIPPVVIPSPTNAGSGKLRDYPQEEAWPDRRREDYWEEREKFLLRHMPVVPAPYIAEKPEVRKVVEKHNHALELAARVHLTGARLVNVGKMLSDLVRQVEQFEQDAEDESIAILLLM